MDEITNIENVRSQIQESCKRLIDYVGPIKIGEPRQFPYGWRDAAKGRTVWRIVEEVITQNLEKYSEQFGIANFQSPGSEVAVYDMACTYGNETAYINIKSSSESGKTQKDDISKAGGLLDFYRADESRHIFIATFFIRFNDDMSIQLTDVSVFPLAWIPDVYVNPSNNGNLQSAHYKNLDGAVRRTNQEFLQLLCQAVEVANQKKQAKS
jgi:hypothetical protein